MEGTEADSLQKEGASHWGILCALLLSSAGPVGGWASIWRAPFGEHGLGYLGVQEWPSARMRAMRSTQAGRKP